MIFSRLRREYEREVIGPGVLREVHRASLVRARKYPPTIYGLSSSWDKEAIEDLVQDVVVERLLGESQIDYLFDVARNLSDWRALLDRQVGITLARRRVRTVVDNLLDRARRALRKNDEVVTSKFSRRTVFTLRRSNKPYRPLTDQQIRRIVEIVRVVPRLRPGRAERTPSLYRRRDFEILLGSVLQEAEGGITVRDLGMIFEEVFTDWLPAVLELDEEGSFGKSESPEAVVEIRETAKQIIEKMTKEDAIIFHGRLAGLPDVEIARLLGISRPTFIKRRNILFNDVIYPLASDLDEEGQDVLLEQIAMATMERRGSDEHDFLAKRYLVQTALG